MSATSEFILLPHDLWGADGFPISRFPGDNGNWTDYDNFLTRVIGDVRAAGLTVQWDIWNEPNITLFWNRPQAQYFELWRRTYQRIRAELPNHLIVGPSCACVPATSHAFWNQYLDFVRANNVVPDIISWHSLPGDPVANVAAANATLDPRYPALPRLPARSQAQRQVRRRQHHLHRATCPDPPMDLQPSGPGQPAQPDLAALG